MAIGDVARLKQQKFAVELWPLSVSSLQCH